ncbi:MAG: type II toxin-antitoxin system VapC family toxin [Pseudonocardia sp.]
MNNVLLDTNVVSEAVRPRPDSHVLDLLAAAEGTAAIAAATWHELRYGVERLPRGRRRTALAEFVREVATRYPVVPYDDRAADWHAGERARLERAGKMRPFADGQIAATAATNGLTLITRNLSDFEGYVGLRVQSWWRAG